MRGQFAGVWRPGRLLGPKKPFLRSLVLKFEMHCVACYSG